MDHGSAELDSSHKSIRLERGPDSPNTGVRLAAATLTIGKRYELSGCGGIAHDVSALIGKSQRAIVSLEAPTEPYINSERAPFAAVRPHQTSRR